MFKGLGFRLQGLGFSAWGLGFRGHLKLGIQGLGFGIPRFGSRVQG